MQSERGGMKNELRQRLGIRIQEGFCHLEREVVSTQGHNPTSEALTQGETARKITHLDLDPSKTE